MKFIVSSNTLLKNVNTIGGVINNNNTLPILDNFLFELKGNELTITGSDLETTISTTFEVESEDEGKIAVPSKILTDTLKTFPAQPLTFIQKDGNTLEIVSEQGNYQLAYEDASEYPQTPDVEEAHLTKLPASVISEAILKTIFATGNDELRPIMTGVLFQAQPDVFNFVATDAHRLVKYSRTGLQSVEAAEYIMPKKPLNLLKNILGGNNDEVTIEYNQTNTRFTFQNIVLTCRLIDGKYPNYDAVIPKENPNVLTINRNLFLSSLKRVAIFSNKTTNQIRLKLIGNSLTISAEDVDFANKAEERLPCEYNGTDLQIGFNSKFLIEMLNNLQSDDITLEMSEPNRAGIIKPVDGLEEGEEILMLVMPVMLNA
ncbi:MULTISPECIES: DNA polymerase III subunit beta [Weeksella]|uniref:Beta sliding clamp n=1 Tax=Weeksella virosa (strain ATCC 43766 / DSM 16922 / JCM 21250 / CCUG 30538 / CDC 9751 / IAM 14551 / NBRC 16016 / NCTC 11634 / CL345/78) TaxID=865938 RepID=F0NYL0_WEEVC|nr:MULTISPECIES: DNA polymerase III subunit beta [Weeksella]ADX67130.1 DNA polymerase III, beta subunit [Weeksella virosa DSM 16922]MDK7375625.1 DNA polymerase III subunit beta [Weeksella virosa]MDK7676241.1 DNA polymerase III subunit beta [Weeksella virosa]OFM81570.1 DNA polymerase III subunit beta [Weeksella sp. HMSC059D05]SUP53401.1 DNA polymerase III subunit beta [Weeksella virosa]